MLEPRKKKERKQFLTELIVLTNNIDNRWFQDCFFLRLAHAAVRYYIEKMEAERARVQLDCLSIAERKRSLLCIMTVLWQHIPFLEKPLYFDYIELTLLNKILLTNIHAAVMPSKNLLTFAVISWYNTRSSVLTCIGKTRSINNRCWGLAG